MSSAATWQMNMNYNISMIDFSKCGLLIAESDVKEQDLRYTGDDLYAALSTVGFAYLKNHGIPWNKVDEMNEFGEKFFSLPLETKKEFEKPGVTLSYDSIGRSKANLSDIDHYEGFRTSSAAYVDDTILWPEVPRMKECFIDFADKSAKLVMRILKALGHGMKLKNKDYFCQVHSRMNQIGNVSLLKVIKYPPIKDAASENRIGEHTDKTTLTLLFQDQVGGLQAKDASDNLVDVHPVPGSIVLNIGTVLEAWSCNRLKATVYTSYPAAAYMEMRTTRSRGTRKTNSMKRDDNQTKRDRMHLTSQSHLVTAPYDTSKRNEIRRSVAYFVLADAQVMMKKLVFEDNVEDDEMETREEAMTVEAYMVEGAKNIFKNFL